MRAEHPVMQVVYLSVNIASWLSTVSRSPAAAAATIFTRASVVPDIADSTVIPRSFVTDYFGYFLHIRGRTHRRASEFQQHFNHKNNQ